MKRFHTIVIVVFVFSFVFIHFAPACDTPTPPSEKQKQGQSQKQKQKQKQKQSQKQKQGQSQGQNQSSYNKITNTLNNDIDNNSSAKAYAGGGGGADVDIDGDEYSNPILPQISFGYGPQDPAKDNQHLNIPIQWFEGVNSSIVAIASGYHVRALYLGNGIYLIRAGMTLMLAEFAGYKEINPRNKTIFHDGMNAEEAMARAVERISTEIKGKRLLAISWDPYITQMQNNVLGIPMALWGTNASIGGTPGQSDGTEYKWIRKQDHVFRVTGEFPVRDYSPSPVAETEKPVDQFLGRIYFGCGKSDILPGHRTEIARMVAQIQPEPQKQVEIDTECSDIATPEVNWQVCGKRARNSREAFVAELVKQGKMSRKEAWNYVFAKTGGEFVQNAPQARGACNDANQSAGFTIVPVSNFYIQPEPVN
jgi:outer membrane protein OmpA-like peptidoglycan-associated protein